MDTSPCIYQEAVLRLVPVVFQIWVLQHIEDVLIDVRRITDITDLPVLVDFDTGWGGVINIARAIKSMINCGAAAVHIEDQVQQKRCGHRPNKAMVSQVEIVDRM